MAVKRIIPCLDVYGGKTVKGVNFVDLREVGDAVELGKKYASEGADELVYLDISATNEERRTFLDLAARLTAAIDIPLTVGGGIASVDDAERLFDVGVDKVSINSAAVADPWLVNRLAAKFGGKRVIVAIDGRRDEAGVWRVTTHGGTRMTEREVVEWAREVQQRNAGQILFTSMEHDGTKSGYPCELFAQLADALTIPVIASGGAGSVEDIVEVLTTGRADAALAASIFHYGEIPIPVLKRELRARGIEVSI
jgi:cyclase